ncbi:unnamed protein product, partial [Rotaria sp. Silwood1]
QEQNEESKKKVIDIEQHQLNSNLPPSNEIPKKIEETKSAYRQYKIDDLTDDENVNENKPKQIKSKAFEKFFAKRQSSMAPPPPPPPISSENVNSSHIEQTTNLTDDNNEKMKQNHVKQIKSKPCRIFFTQRPMSSSSMPTLSPKVNSSRTQTMIDLTE